MYSIQPQSAESLNAKTAPLRAVAEDVFEFECRDKYGNVRWRDKIINRVVTTGLNQLLQATFVAPASGSTSWYIGLMGQSAGSITTNVSNGNITDTPENPWQSVDATRAFLGKGMGAGGADLSTTIATYANGSLVTLTATPGAAFTGNGVAAWDLRPADTLASHAPWVEVTPYTGNRPAWTPGSVSSGSVTNSGSPATFSITTAGPTNVFGAFLCNANSGTAAILYGGGLWASGVVRAVLAGDTLTATVTVSITST